MARAKLLGLGFEARLELSIELVQAILHPTGDAGPTPILQRSDGNSQFKLDRILRLKITRKQQVIHLKRKAAQLGLQIIEVATAA